MTIIQIWHNNIKVDLKQFVIVGTGFSWFHDVLRTGCCKIRNIRILYNHGIFLINISTNSISRKVSSMEGRCSGFVPPCACSDCIRQAVITCCGCVHNLWAKIYILLQFWHKEGTYISLTLILLTWRKWWTPNNASKWQMGFNSAFKGLIHSLCC